ncbi:MAG: type VI secretion system baseplate subunit TssK [Alphaproteobacteria bacterium]|nr:type VI secretion system baseplate subunit TssK [Alphaproteobacteria bacterium]
MYKDRKKILQIPLEINWHEGMLLSQHHFQQNDLRTFRVLATQLQLLSSYHYGIRHLRIDTVSLSEGIYRINELEAVFQDGLIFSYFPEKQKGLIPLEADIRSLTSDTDEFTVLLCVAESSDETSPLLGNPPRYYSLDGNIIDDQNINGNTTRIPRLFPNAFLHVGEVVPEFCIGFPICKIIKLDGVFHVKNWTPPCFFIERHFPLWKRCESLAISLREKAVYLSEKLKNSSGNATDNLTSQLKQIISILPGIEALVYSEEIRPYDLYQELAETLGAISTSIPTDIIPMMQPYNHQNIDECLYRVIVLIEHYLSVIDRGFSVHPFNKNERFFYRYFSLNELQRIRNNKLYIGIKLEKNVEFSLVESWMNNAIIVSDFAIDTVRKKRTNGPFRHPMKYEDISKIIPGAGIHLFEVDLDENFIKAEQNLHIFNPGTNLNIAPKDIILYLPKGES